MGAIVDTLFIEKSDLGTLKRRYPDCVTINETGSEHLIQRYRVIIPNEELFDDGYYLFLLDNGIAMSSASFLARVESDRKFAARMTERVALDMAKMQGQKGAAGE